MEIKSTLIMAMADHVPGQLLGAAIDDLVKLGARGVYTVPSITKKDRPGTILMIEPGGAEAQVAIYLARELKIGGYQRLETFHVFQETRWESRKVTIKAPGVEETFLLKAKVVGPEQSPFYISAEADDALMISDALERKHGLVFSAQRIKTLLEAHLSKQETDLEIWL